MIKTLRTNYVEGDAMAKLGIIGGLGPLATAYYLQLLVDMTEAKCDQEHFEMSVYSCPQIPDRTGHILTPHQVKSPVPKIKELIAKLEDDGALIITIPCITAHYFHSELEENCSVPIVNLVEETVKYLQCRGVTRVGIMATDGTIHTGLFQKELEHYQMCGVIPDKEHQKKVMAVIYEQVKKGVPVCVEDMQEVEAHLRGQGAEVIIYGCTELSIAKRDGKAGRGVLDALDVLASCAVEKCGVLKEEYRQLIAN